MDFLAAALTVLRDEAKPLHWTVIQDLALRRGLDVLARDALGFEVPAPALRERLGHAVRDFQEPIDQVAVLILLARVAAGPAIGSCGVAGCHAASVWTDASRMSGKAPPPVIASRVPIPAARSLNWCS